MQSCPLVPLQNQVLKVSFFINLLNVSHIKVLSFSFFIGNQNINDINHYTIHLYIQMKLYT